MSNATNQLAPRAFSELEPLEPRLLLSAVDVTVELAHSIIPIGASTTLTVYGQVVGQPATEQNNGIFGWDVDLILGTPSIVSPLSPADVDPLVWTNNPLTSSAGTVVANGLNAIYDTGEESLTLGLGSRVVLFTVTITAAQAGSTTLTIGPDLTVGTDFATWNEDFGGNYGAASITLTVVPQDGQVVGREIFYNGSLADGNNPAANAADDAAIDAAKDALLPGQDAALVNFTGYGKGINGIMIDVDGLLGTPTAADFVFKVGNTADPSGWVLAAAPQSITVRAGAGANGSDRVTIIWADNVIQDGWLQVEVLPSINNTLADSDVFYWGNLRGDYNGDTTVSQADLDLVLLNYNSAAPANWVNGRPEGAVAMAQYTTMMGNWGKTLTLLSAPSSQAMAPMGAETSVLESQGGEELLILDSQPLAGQTLESPAYFVAEEVEPLDMALSPMVALESTSDPESVVAPASNQPAAEVETLPRNRKYGQAVRKAKGPGGVEDILAASILMPLQ